MTCRKFIIRSVALDNKERYVHKIYKKPMEYIVIRTMYKDNARIWKYERVCKQMVLMLNMKQRIKKFEYCVEEISDINIIRKIKLKKLK